MGRPAEEQFAATENAFAARRGAGDRRILDFALGVLPLAEHQAEVVLDRLRGQLARGRGVFHERPLDFAAHAEKDRVIEHLFDLGVGHQRLEGGHRGAVEAVSDRLSEISAGRLPAGDRGSELVGAVAVIARAREEERGGRPVPAPETPWQWTQWRRYSP